MVWEFITNYLPGKTSPMRSRTVGTLAIIVLVFVGCSAGVAAAEDVALTVSVVDQNGDPVDGATVEAVWGDGETTATTASNGKVFIDVPKGSDIELDIDDDRYVRNQPLLIENATEREVEVPVFRQGNSSITVVDTDGEPLPEATVRIQRDGEAITSGETDSDGLFEAESIEQGPYRVSAVKPGFYSVEENLTVAAKTETEITLESGRVTLNVDVVDDHFEEPQTLSDARVLVESDPFDADVRASDGSASLNVPVNTRYRVIATKDGYEGTPRQLSVREKPRAVTVTAQRVPELTVRASNSRVIVGETTRIEVTNAYDEPVSGATVRVNDEAVGETDDRGELSVEIDSAGEATIVASDGQIDSEPITVTGIDPSTPDEDEDEEPAETSDGTSPETPEEQPEDTPGFGIAVAIIALFLVFTARRIHSR